MLYMADRRSALYVVSVPAVSITLPQFAVAVATSLFCAATVDSTW